LSIVDVCLTLVQLCPKHGNALTWPSHLFSPKWRILINVKLAAFVISAVGLLAITLKQAGGIGDTLHEPSVLQGSERAWTIVCFFLLAAAGCSTFASNATDFQRNSSTANSPILGQVVGFPVSNFIVTLIGMIVASSSKRVYGEVSDNQFLAQGDLTILTNTSSGSSSGTH
jgi:NCS1 family nucleobase:cation symporter-1